MEKIFEKYFEIFSFMAIKNKLLWKIHYDNYILKDGNYVLRINYKKAIEILREYYDELQISSESAEENEKAEMLHISLKWLDVSNFRNELKEKNYCIGYNTNVRFFTENGGYKLYRAAIIDIYILQCEGVNIDGLLVNNNRAYKGSYNSLGSDIQFKSQGEN